MNGGVLAAAAVIGYLVLVYSTATGLGRSASSRARHDRALLVSGARTPGGVVAALVAATQLLDVAGPHGALMPSVVLVFALGCVVATGSRWWRWPREVAFLLIGVFAVAARMLDVFGGACASALPSFVVAVFGVAPVGVLLCAHILRSMVRPRAFFSDTGRAALAALAVLDLGVFAAHPAGLPLLDAALHGGATAAVALGAWVAVVVAAAGCGLRPRAGADLLAMGVLVANVALAGLSTPCGLDLVAGTLTVITFLTAFGIVRMGARRGS